MSLPKDSRETSLAMKSKSKGSPKDEIICKETVQNIVNIWKDIVKEWYPDIQKQAHFVPDVLINRVLHEKTSLANVRVSVIQAPKQETEKGEKDVLQKAHVRDDKAQQHVLHCLRAIADGKLPGKERPVMFVLSRLNFGDYLSEAYFERVSATLPRPVDLQMNRGDFDILIIHQDHGLLTAEIKSVGFNAAERQASEDTRIGDLQRALRKMLNLTKDSQALRGKSEDSGQLKDRVSNESLAAGQNKDIIQQNEKHPQETDGQTEDHKQQEDKVPQVKRGGSKDSSQQKDKVSQASHCQSKVPQEQNDKVLRASSNGQSEDSKQHGQDKDPNRPRKDTRHSRKHGQLQKAREMLEHLTGDFTPRPPVKITLILPYTEQRLLRKALGQDTELQEALRSNLGLCAKDDVTEFCLCADHMPKISSPLEIPDDALKKLDRWWSLYFPEEEKNAAMPDIYVDIVARFAGPATVVSIYCPTEPRLRVAEMRTKGQGVDQTHKRLTRIALYPSQMNILQDGRDLIVLKGPPGTGKTLMLVLKALMWVKEGQSVHIVNTRLESRAAVFYIRNQMKETLERQKKKWAVKDVHVSFLTTGEKDDKAVEEMVQNAKNDQLCLIADEADGKVLSALYRTLHSHNLRRLRLWAAGVKCNGFPQALEGVELTDPLRCPPSVIRVLAETKSLKNKEVPQYKEPEAPPPTDGPPVKDLYHKREFGHDGDSTMECETCGREIAEYLKTYVHLGQPVRTSDGGSTKTAVRYRDVFILTWDPDIRPENYKGKSRPPYKVVSGMRNAGMPVRVIADDDVEAIQEIAEMKGEDKAVLTGAYTVWGLERKVVVWLGRNGGTFEKLRENRDYDETGGRLYPVSRCTALLVWVHDENKPNTSEVKTGSVGASTVTAAGGVSTCTDGAIPTEIGASVSGASAAAGVG